MSTISSIGTASRDYSTIGAWLAAFASGGWIGECYKDSEFVEDFTIDQSTSATDFLTLRAAAGQSVFDNSANPIRYDATKGVAITCTNNFDSTVTVLTSFVTIERLQIKHPESFGGVASAFVTFTGVSSVYANRCLFLSEDSAAGGLSSNTSVLFISAEVAVTNCVIISYKFNGCAVFYTDTLTAIANCTFVVPTDKSTTASALIFANAFADAIITNCAFFGFASVLPSGTLSGGYNASDQTIPFGSNNLPSLTYANQFTNTASATLDVRLKAGADLIDAGTADTTDIPGAIDIFGTARPQGTAWDIGAFEYVPAAAALTLMGQAFF